MALLNAPLSQRGVILIVILWFIAMVTVMVATLARETQLSATTVFHNHDGLQEWSDILKAFQFAQMEILMLRMAPSPDDKERQEFLKENLNWEYRFDGRPLNLAYMGEDAELPENFQLPEYITVRIYDNVGKINLAYMDRNRFRELLKKRIGDKPEELDKLIDAWEDWVDADDLKRTNGAEKEYYEEERDPPYQPRNGRLESVDELRLIKGFEDLFTPQEMETAFTIYGNTRTINPNFATREALLMIPGMDARAAEQILIRRQTKNFKTPADYNEFMQPEQLAEFLPWVSFSNSNYYTIIIQVDETKKRQIAQQTTENDTEEEQIQTNIPAEDAPIFTAGEQTAEQAYTVTVQMRGISRLPKVLLVKPYGFIPDTRHENYIFDLEQNQIREKTPEDLEEENP